MKRVLAFLLILASAAHGQRLDLEADWSQPGKTYNISVPQGDTRTWRVYLYQDNVAATMSSTNWLPEIQYRRFQDPGSVSSYVTTGSHVTTNYAEVSIPENFWAFPVKDWYMEFGLRSTESTNQYLRLFSGTLDVIPSGVGVSNIFVVGTNWFWATEQDPGLVTHLAATNPHSISITSTGATVTVTTNGAAFNLEAAGSTDDQTASEVAFTPAGDIAATNVQAAVEELDTEKFATADAGALASEDWPASDGQEYVAKNGAWAVKTGSGDASGWSGYAATQTVNMASFGATNVGTVYWADDGDMTYWSNPTEGHSLREITGDLTLSAGIFNLDLDGGSVTIKGNTPVTTADSGTVTSNMINWTTMPSGLQDGDDEGGGGAATNQHALSASGVSGTWTIDYDAGIVQEYTITNTVTNVTVSGATASEFAELTIVVNNPSLYAVTWPTSNWYWVEGEAPSMTTNGWDVFSMWSHSNKTWIGRSGGSAQ